MWLFGGGGGDIEVTGMCGQDFQSRGHSVRDLQGKKGGRLVRRVQKVGSISESSHFVKKKGVVQ